ncbi:hypothetical protein M3J09_004424 [Ascochyta lentis]
MRKPKGDSSARVRGAGGRICMVPVAFPMFPALASWSHNCRQTDLLQAIYRLVGTSGVRGQLSWSTLPAAPCGCAGFIQDELGCGKRAVLPWLRHLQGRDCCKNKIRSNYHAGYSRVASTVRVVVFQIWPYW